MDRMELYGIENKLAGLCGLVEDLATSVESVAREIARLVEVGRFVVASEAESGLDPLAHTAYADDDADEEEEGTDPGIDIPSWINREESR
jgi:hypothetical protein